MRAAINIQSNSPTGAAFAGGSTTYIGTNGLMYKSSRDAGYWGNRRRIRTWSPNRVEGLRLVMIDLWGAEV